MITAKDITAKYFNIPYKLYGKSLDGMDCWGLVENVYKDAGLDISFVNPEYNEETKWDLSQIPKEFEKVYDQKFLDIVIFSGKQQHCGVVLDGFKFINLLKGGCVIGRLNSRFWRDQRIGYYRLKNADKHTI